MVTCVPDIPLPHPPAELLESALSIYHDSASNPIIYYPIEESVFRFVDSKNGLEWARTHIADDCYSAGIHTIENGSYGPHIDNVTPSGKIRYFSLIYPLETGGDPYTNLYYTDQQMVDEIRQNTKWIRRPEELTKIAGFQFKKHTWNLLNNQCLHSVDGVTSTRVCFTINWFDPRPQSLVRLGLI